MCSALSGGIGQGASQVIVVNTALVWKFIANRAQVKSQMVDSRLRYLEAITVEKMRAERF